MVDLLSLITFGEWMSAVSFIEVGVLGLVFAYL
jgi:hypothetical protein